MPYLLLISDTVFSPLMASKATFAFNPASCVLLILPPVPVVLLCYNTPKSTVQFLGETSAVAVQAEFKEVGENQVGEGVEVALELFSVLYSVKVVLCRSFCLYVADDFLFPVPDAEVRVACVGLFGERCNTDIFFVD